MVISEYDDSIFLVGLIIIWFFILHIDNIPEDVIPGLEIPTGIPLVYTLDEKTLKPIKDKNACEPLSARFEGDPALVAAAQEKVKNQTKA